MNAASAQREGGGVRPHVALTSDCFLNIAQRLPKGNASGKVLEGSILICAAAEGKLREVGTAGEGMEMGR